ncbi:MAG: hypothetical protein Q9210_003831 [Variospora velana]
MAACLTPVLLQASSLHLLSASLVETVHVTSVFVTYCRTTDTPYNILDTPALPSTLLQPLDDGTCGKNTRTAAVAASQITSPPVFPGPFAPSELAERIPGFSKHYAGSSFTDSIKYLSHLHLQEVQGNRRAGTSRPCPGVRGNHLAKDEVHMSQGPSATRPLSSQRNDDRYKALPPLESRTLPPINNSLQAGSAHPGQYTPLSAKATPAASPMSQKSSRLLGMHNILNPASKEADGQTRRRKADQAELPSPATTAASRFPSNSMTPSPGTVSLPSITPPSMNTYLPPVGQGLRQTSTPRSATGYPPNLLTSSLPGTIDAKVSPFVGSTGPMSTYTSESKTGSDFPSSHSHAGPSYGGIFPPTRSPPQRRPSGGSQLPGTVDARASIAGSDSPSTTYSSYSQFSHTPPAVQTVAPVGQPSSAFFGLPYPAPGHGPSLAHGFGSSGPLSGTTTQSPYQMMTMDTEQGPIQVPVDVQAASKVADEKRKRNATASHRFRQRRKEKERETSSNIAKLEKQIQDIEQEKDFYRQERDYFRRLVCRNPNQAHLAARPPSPRHLQAATNSDGEDGLVSGQWQPPEDGHQSGRNTRRRTSSYVPAQDIPRPLSSMPVPQQQQQQQAPAQHGYPQLQPANMRSEDMQSRAPGRGQPSSTFAPPNHAATWHPSRR